MLSLITKLEFVELRSRAGGTMLHIEVDESLLTKDGSKTVRKLTKKVEKELLLFPQLQIFVKVTSKSAKATEIYTYAVYLDQRFFEEKFVSKNWEPTVQQCVSYLIRSIRSEFLHQKSLHSTRYETL